MFSFIRLELGQPLISLSDGVNLIAGTRTILSPRIKAKLDQREHENEIPMTKERMRLVKFYNLTRPTH